MAKEQPFYLKKPFTTEEVRVLSSNGKNKFATFVPISLEEMIENDTDTVVSIIAERIHESGLLSEFEFEALHIIDEKNIVLHVKNISVDAIFASEE